jgi:hypothetical protein
LLVTVVEATRIRRRRRRRRRRIKKKRELLGLGSVAGGLAGRDGRLT